MNCANCQHDKRLHSLDITAREAKDLTDHVPLSVYRDDGQCLVPLCTCGVFGSPRVTIELDPDDARAFVDAFRKVIPVPELHPLYEAIRRALEAQQ